MPQQKVAYNGCYDFSSNHHSHSHSHHSVPNNEGGFHSIPEMQRARQQMKTYRRKLKLETITNTEYKHYMNLQQRMKPRWMKHKKQYLPPKCIYDDADADACNDNVDQICKDIGELELFDSEEEEEGYEPKEAEYPRPKLRRHQILPSQTSPLIHSDSYLREPRGHHGNEVKHRHKDRDRDRSRARGKHRERRRARDRGADRERGRGRDREKQRRRDNKDRGVDRERRRARDRGADRHRGDREKQRRRDNKDRGVDRAIGRRDKGRYSREKIDDNGRNKRDRVRYRRETFDEKEDYGRGDKRRGRRNAIPSVL
eukprot:705201_1